MKNTWYILFLMFISCKSTEDTAVIRIDGYNESEKLNGESLAIDSFYIVPLEYTEKSIITEIQKIDFIDSLVVVHAANGLFAFNNQTGKYICSYGNRGNGFGEYNVINTFWIDKQQKQVCLIDGNRNCILTYYLNGKVIDNKQYPEKTFSLLQGCEKLNQNELFISKYIFNDINQIYTQINLDEKKEIPLYQFPVNTNNTEERIGKHPFGIYNDSIKCIVPFDNHIYLYSKNEIKPEISIQTALKILTASEIKNIKDFNISSYSTLINQGYFVGFTDIYETSNDLYLGFFDLNYFLVDKNNNKGTLYSSSIDNQEIKRLPFLNIIGTYNDFFVGAIEAQEISNWKYSDSQLSTHCKEVKNKASKISPNDNHY